jgi:hypothetical protein
MRGALGLCLVAMVGCGDSGEKVPKVCPVEEALADAGTLPALQANRCNVSGSMGARKWYRLAATLTDGTIVQIELYDSAGAFAGGTVRTGSFPVETGFGSCGVCLRAIGDKGMATETEYEGTGGTVNITALGINGQPISATVTGATFAEVDTNHAPVSGGCTASLAGVKIDGVVVDKIGMGGGGGGGNGCPTTIGD